MKHFITKIIRRIIYPNPALIFDTMKKYAVIVAGGEGQRMGSTIPKQFLVLAGKQLLWYTLQTFLHAFEDLQIILVLPEAHLKEGENFASMTGAAERVTVIAGGKTRFHSVQNGLKLITDESIIFVHDGVRCLVTDKLLQRCFAQALHKGSAIPAVAATDSIRIVDEEGQAVADRNSVRIIQTPQTFRSTILLPAFFQEYREDFTDEATVVEASGQEIFLIEGEYDNIKVTRPIDLVVAEKILEERRAPQKL